MYCPNFETCEGELRFKVSSVWQGVDAWNTHAGDEAECTEQTCDCELTDEQWDSLCKDAIDATSPSAGGRPGGAEAKK